MINNTKLKGIIKGAVNSYKGGCYDAENKVVTDYHALYSVNDKFLPTILELFGELTSSYKDKGNSRNTQASEFSKIMTSGTMELIDIGMFMQVKEDLIVKVLWAKDFSGYTFIDKKYSDVIDYECWANCRLTTNGYYYSAVFVEYERNWIATILPVSSEDTCGIVNSLRKEMKPKC